MLLNTLKTFNMAPPGRAREETAETVERLRSLGYIGGGTAAVKETYTEADDPKRLIELEQAMQRGADAYAAGRVAEAIEQYRSVIAKRPDTEDAYRKLALVYWRAGRPADAIATLESALRNGVTQREVRNKLGQVPRARPDSRAARLPCSSTTPATIPTRSSRSATPTSSPAGIPMRCAPSAASSRSIRTAGWATRTSASHSCRTASFAAAESALRKAIALDPTLGGAHTALGVVLASTGRKPEAIDTWKRALALDASDSNALFNITLNLAEAGRQDEARTFGERFIAAAPAAMREDADVVRRVIR